MVEDITARKRHERQAAAQHAVSAVLAEGPDLEEAIGRILDHIGAGFAYDYAALWLVDDALGRLRCAGLRAVGRPVAAAFEAATRGLTLAPGEGLPGRVWAQASPITIRHAPADSDFARAAAAGLNAATGYPVCVGDLVVGILELFAGTGEPPAPDEVFIMKSVTGQLGQFIVRKRAEEALRESEARFRTMADHAAVMIWVLDEAQHPIFLNRRSLDFAGLPPEEAVARWRELLHPDDAEGLRAIIKPAWQARQPFEAEYRVRRSDGEYRWLANQAVPRLAPDGTFLGYIGSAIDITEHRRAEEELHRLSARLLQLQDEERRRVARDLHDVTAQDLFALTINLARLQHLVPSTVRAVQELLADTRALGDQSLRELRTLSYVLHPPVLDEIGLASALEWYVDGFRRRSGIDVALAISGETGRLPEDVETALFRIVQEGLTNIHRHSGSGTASITLTRASDAICLRIEDQGRGLAVERTAAADARPSPGVGIPGMRERVRQLGGRLEIVSNGRGTTVTATVPLKEEHAP
jgi:PAS domain S-box-containing protein